MVHHRIQLKLFCLLAIPGIANSAAGQCGPGGFELRHVGSTTMEIVVAWKPQAGASRYVLERSLEPTFSTITSYSLSAAVNAYGDTGKAPNDKFRFHAPSGLFADTTYYYRVRATFPATGDILSDCVSATPAPGPTRGVAGDLYADIVLGQPDFGMNSFGKTARKVSEWAGGVHVDRTHTPNRLFLADANHNRILGFADLGGHCAPAVGTNLALGRTYTKSLAPSLSHPDTGDAEFTDGSDSTAWQTDSGDSFGYQALSGSLDVTIDLGGVTSVNVVSLNSGALTDRYTAGSMEISLSTDGASYASVGTFDNVPRKLFDIALAFPTITARYVRFRLTMQSGCTDCDWLFLGEGRVGAMTSAALDDSLSRKACATDADCADESACQIEGYSTPSLVLGQPDFTDRSSCNGDSTGQAYPSRVPASASSLCLIHPEQISIGETVFASFMDTDSAGNLFVSDLYNNRVLEFDDPFGTDQVADAVWGQADFAGNLCNRGAAALSAELGCKSLCFADVYHAGVAVDDTGNLWVADAQNSRVLRFPRSGGAIADTADVVLGQSNCTERSPGGAGRALNRMGVPLDVAFDRATGRLYVADTLSGPSDSRVLEFTPPFSTGMLATRALPISPYCDFAFPATMPIDLALDTQRHALWVQNSCFFTELFDLDQGDLPRLERVKIEQNQGVDVDGAGDLFVVGKWSSVFRFRRGADGLSAPQPIFPEPYAWVSADSFWGSVQGVARLGSQLIVSDAHRLLLWNNVDVDTLANKQPADDVHNEPDFTTAVFSQYYAYPQVYNGDLWIERNSSRHEVLRFEAPLTNCISGGCVPAQSIPLNGIAGYVVRGTGGTRIQAAGANWLDFAPARDGDELWIADRWNNRVFRVANLNGARGGGEAFVDVILGQGNATTVQCNRGGSVAANTLCYPYDLALDAHGNLFVADNGGEAGSNHRMLEFDAALFPTGIPASAVFGPNASRVFGTGGSFTLTGDSAANDPFISPFKPAFSSDGYLVVGNNPYATQRFPVVYLNPLAERMPQFVLGDFTSYPSGSYSFDDQGNLYFADSNWSRILIYKQPFLRLQFGQTPTPTPTGTPACAASPIAGCRTPAVGQKAFLMLKDKAPNNAKDVLQWKWSRGSDTAKGDFGAPLTSSSYQLCIYNGAPIPILDATIPAGGLCIASNPKPCWRDTTKGFDYKDKDLTPDGIQQLKLKAGFGGQAQIILKGKGDLLDDPAIPVTLPVTVQLLNSEGVCWEAVYGTAIKNTAGPPSFFKAKAD